MDRGGGKITHGYRVGNKNPTEYVIWRGMLARCRNPKRPAYHRYGGRGIKVCERWLKFENFLADMGERPANKTIDRIDNNGNYEPGNCRWATWKEQNRNARGNHLVNWGGQHMILTELCEMFGVKFKSVSRRLIRGWDLEKAIFVPFDQKFTSKKNSLMVEFNGSKLLLKDLAKARGLNYHTVRWRIKHGWSVEDALSLNPSH